VAFDVNETLSDLAPMGKRFEAVGAPEALARLWFASVLRDGFALTAAGSNARFADIAAGLLRSMLPAAGVSGDLEQAVAHILDGFSRLDVHPDVVPGVRALREEGLRLVTLSNGSASVAEALLGGAGVRGEFEHLLSVEEPGVWKPAAEAYHFAAARCAVPAHDMLLVAVHPWDIDGAARAGLRTAWVNREHAHYPEHMTAPTHTVGSLTDLAAVLA
jgi:2-haloacid dehalogenase